MGSSCVCVCARTHAPVCAPVWAHRWRYNYLSHRALMCLLAQCLTHSNYSTNGNWRWWGSQRSCEMLLTPLCSFSLSYVALFPKSPIKIWELIYILCTFRETVVFYHFTHSVKWNEGNGKEKHRNLTKQWNSIKGGLILGLVLTVRSTRNTL